MEEDKTKSEYLIEWADSCYLAFVMPDGPTSRRSTRTIDYGLTAGVPFRLQVLQEDTNSDHFPILGVLDSGINDGELGKRINWTVFTSFMSYVFTYWENLWANRQYEENYNNFVDFIVSLMTRCTSHYSQEMARPAIPYWLRKTLAKSRALQVRAKRTGDVMCRIEAWWLRKWARAQLKILRMEQLEKLVKERQESGEGTSPFWSKAKRHFQDKSSTIQAILEPSGKVIRDERLMVEAAADYYEQLFKDPEVYRPHPYVDSQPPTSINDEQQIPPVTYPELIKVLKGKKRKSSCDAHGMSPLLLSHIPNNYWHLIIPLFNLSLSTSYMPAKWKDVRMVILAKKSPICASNETRPISLLDSIFKIQERLFLTRFLEVVNAHGLLPDNQSGFRANHRLQTRVLLLVEQISSLMANSAPVCTVFVDFRSAFDQLWFDGCVGKLTRLGIPPAFVTWIKSWLYNRRGYIDLKGHSSRWFPIRRGGPQGSSLTPSIFITYHSDLSDAIPQATSFLFADDVAATMAGQLGVKHTDQCIDLERRLSAFFRDLEYYAILAVQPINYNKTMAMWSARSISYPNPMPRLKCGGHDINWTDSYKYLGYWITTKLGWSMLIKQSLLKIRQRTAMINNCRFAGASSKETRRILFAAFVYPLFAWLFAMVPLFTYRQQSDLSHAYFSCLKRVYRCMHWENFFFAVWFKEWSLDFRCLRYWKKFCKALSRTEDGLLLLEQLELCTHRQSWLDGMGSIWMLRRNKRLINRKSVLGSCLEWCAQNQIEDSVPVVKKEDLETLVFFPETF